MSTGFGKVSKGSPWYPSSRQISDPRSLEITLRRVLDQHYTLADKVAAGAGAGAATSTSKSDAPPTTPNGPASTTLLGLRVEPIDTSTLADGATLKYSKSRGTLFFG